MHSYLLLLFFSTFFLQSSQLTGLEQPLRNINSPTSREFHIKNEPVPVGVIGLVHTHVHWILGRDQKDDIRIVGIVEPNRELAQRYSEQHGFSMDIVFDSIDQMVKAVKPKAVTAFNTIHGHLEVVEYCAPRGIHVMVEKPLAVNLKHAKKMKALAKEHGIHLLTNYETSWYPSSHAAFDLVFGSNRIPNIKKINFYLLLPLSQLIFLILHPTIFFLLALYSKVAASSGLRAKGNPLSNGL